VNPSQNPNAALLLAAVQKLAPLLDQIVFVGGCAAGLLITDPGAAPVRPTVDVDAIVELASYAGLIDIEERLRRLGFEQPHVEGAPPCRWVHGDVVFDLMPTDSTILGFSNRWYSHALKNAETAKIRDHQIKLITAPCFLATKLTAFHGRGQFDYRMSHDLEDIVAVLDGRPEVVVEAHRSETSLQQYLSGEFSALLSERDFLEALPGHLLPDSVNQQRARIVLMRMQEIVGRR
jgi:predicted nucleotidyltransferase